MVQDDFLKYRPSDSEMNELSAPYSEVWQGLPDIIFRETKSRGSRPALVYEGEEGYVWISPTALGEYRQDPQTISIAVVNSPSDRRLDVVGLVPQKGTLDAVLRKVKRFNEDEIRKNRERARKNKSKK